MWASSRFGLVGGFHGAAVPGSVHICLYFPLEFTLDMATIEAFLYKFNHLFCTSFVVREELKKRKLIEMDNKKQGFVHQNVLTSCFFVSVSEAFRLQIKNGTYKNRKSPHLSESSQLLGSAFFMLKNALSPFCLRQKLVTPQNLNPNREK